MPTIGNPLGTSQDYIPLVNATELGKAGGLHIHFPTLAGLQAAVTAERANITAASPTWSPGQPFTVAGEAAGVYRVWFIGANAGLSHARTAVLSTGLTLLLAADTNTITTTTVAPSGGNNGDVLINPALNLYYVRSGGTWSGGTAIFAGGSAVALTDPGTGSPAVAALGVDASGNTVAKIISQTNTLANLLAATGVQGQIAVPTDAPGIVRYTGVPGGAQRISPNNIKVVDTKPQTAGAFNHTIGEHDTHTHFLLADASAVSIVLTMPTGTSGQKIVVSSDYSSEASLVDGYPAGSEILYQKIKKTASPDVESWSAIDIRTLAGNNGGTAYDIGTNSTSAAGGRVYSPNSFAAGYGATIGLTTVSDSSVAVGPAAYVEGQSGLALGEAAYVEGAYGVALGRLSSVMGDGGTAVGASAQVLANYGIAIGNNSRAPMNTAMIQLNGGNIRHVILRRSLTAAGTLEMSLDAAAPSGTANRLRINASGVYVIDVEIVARTNAATSLKAYHRMSRLTVHVTGGSASTGTLAILGAVTDVVAAASSGVATNAPSTTITIDDTNKSLKIDATVASIADGIMIFTAFVTVKYAAF